MKLGSPLDNVRAQAWEKAAGLVEHWRDDGLVFAGQKDTDQLAKLMTVAAADFALIVATDRLRFGDRVAAEVLLDFSRQMSDLALEWWSWSGYALARCLVPPGRMQDFTPSDHPTLLPVTDDDPPPPTFP